MFHFFKKKYYIFQCFKSSFCTNLGIKKDSIFTISFIGRPNVGKSTLMNSLAGERVSLVDNTPGLTRDRKEFTMKIGEMKIKLVDTAGVEHLSEEFKSDDAIVNHSINQSRSALVLSNLAFFVIDAKAGITETDIKLANWINERRNFNQRREEINKEFLSLKESKDVDDETRKKLYENYEKMLKSKEVTIPNVKLIVNKAENGFKGEILKKYRLLNLGEPVFISAEHGDNMHDIYKIIDEEIPESYKIETQKKIDNRYKRYYEYRDKLYEDFLEYASKTKAEDKITKEEWESDYDKVNYHNIEDNSDYDSDNEIDPLDHIVTQRQKDQKGVTSDNKLKKRKIKIAIVGRTNVGKSSIVNTLLKDNRLIVSDIAGTTRDCVPIEWVYKGKRLILVDTAGIQPRNRVYSKIDKMISAQTIKTIKFSHVVVYIIDSMTAFSEIDMKLINFIGEEGRAIVFVSNKWDLVENSYKTKAKKWIETQLRESSDHYKNTKIVFCSAKSFFHIDDIMEEVLASYEGWNSRISTGVLNDWVKEIRKVKDAPSYQGEELKLRFMTQISTRPPTFTVFLNKISLLNKSHELFLKKMLCREFNMKNVPVRLLLRDPKKINKINKYKKMSISTAKISRKINNINKRFESPTYRKKYMGAKILYGKGMNRTSYKKYR